MFHGLKCEIEDYITELWSDDDMDFVIKLKKLDEFYRKS
jgi:hypothetical protein